MGEVVADADRDALAALMTTLRDDPRFAFEQVMDICGVDWPDRAERFDVVYNLLSVSLNQRLRVIVTTDENMPVPSVHTIWPVATWWEREAWDLFGIVFSGQPDLRRILTDYGFEGHPLRKDFPLTGYVEVRYDEDRKAVVYEPVKLMQDFRNFDFVSPWEAMITLPGDEKVHAARAAEAAPPAAETKAEAHERSLRARTFYAVEPTNRVRCCGGVPLVSWSTRRDLDWPNIAEEIESMGERRMHAVELLLVKALAHRLKVEAWPTSREVPGWLAEARRFRDDADQPVQPTSMRLEDRRWRNCIDRALRALPETNRRSVAAAAAAGLRRVTLDELLSDQS